MDCVNSFDRETPHGDIAKEMDVLCITDELRKIRWRWFGHVVRREEHNATKKARMWSVS